MAELCQMTAKQTALAISQLGSVRKLYLQH